MRAPGKKKPLRTADGRPEMRSPDQILKDAAAEIRHDLPNKGRRLDLDAYFRGGAEDRIANRLLKDNGVLPQHLHDRKEAETWRETAERELAKDEKRLTELADEIAEHLSCVARFLGDRPFALPDGLVVRPLDGDPPSASEARAALETAVRRIQTFARKRTDALAGFRASLNAANVSTDRYNQQIAATGQLMPAYPAAYRIDTDEQAVLADRRLPQPIVWAARDRDGVLLAVKARYLPLERLKSLLKWGT